MRIRKTMRSIRYRLIMFCERDPRSGSCFAMSGASLIPSFGRNTSRCALCVIPTSSSFGHSLLYSRSPSLIIVSFPADTRPGTICLTLACRPCPLPSTSIRPSHTTMNNRRASHSLSHPCWSSPPHGQVQHLDGTQLKSLHVYLVDWHAHDRAVYGLPFDLLMDGCWRKNDSDKRFELQDPDRPCTMATPKEPQRPVWCVNCGSKWGPLKLHAIPFQYGSEPRRTRYVSLPASFPGLAFLNFRLPDMGVPLPNGGPRRLCTGTSRPGNISV